MTFRRFRMSHVLPGTWGPIPLTGNYSSGASVCVCTGCWMWGRGPASSSSNLLISGYIPNNKRRTRFICCLCVCFCVYLPLELRRGCQIRLEPELQVVVSPPTWPWELNSGSLQEQDVLLAAEPSQPHNLMTRNSLHKHWRFCQESTNRGMWRTGIPRRGWFISSVWRPAVFHISKCLLQ